MSGTMTPRLLAATPHRLLFFVGAVNVLLAMAWWAVWLVDQRWQLHWLPPAPVHAGWIHAFAMQYQLLPPFMFGFLLTVFPRWLGLPDVERWRYLPVGAGLMGGQLAILLGAAGWPGASVPVLVVGHQPTLGMAAARLLAGADQPWAVKKAAVWWLRLRERDGSALNRCLKLHNI